MALLQKNPHINLDIPLFQSVNEGSILIVGLGNPGEKFKNTRHNIGFACADAFAKEHDFPSFKAKTTLKSSLSTHTIAAHQIIVAKPHTYMNLSGDAVQLIASFYNVKIDAIFVIHDDIDISFGSVRTKKGGGAAGHNGVSSIIRILGQDFARIRVGVGPKPNKQTATDSFVLGSFTQDEQASMPILIKEVVALLTEVIFSKQDFSPETRTIIT